MQHHADVLGQAGAVGSAPGIDGIRDDVWTWRCGRSVGQYSVDVVLAARNLAPYDILGRVVPRRHHRFGDHEHLALVSTAFHLLASEAQCVRGRRENKDESCPPSPHGLWRDFGLWIFAVGDVIASSS